jgi:MFS family permease
MVGVRVYLNILRTPGAFRFVPPAFVARFPMAMIGISVTLMISGLYGSYELAGIVTAITTIGTAIGAPIVGGLVDRQGQGRVGRPLIAIFALSCFTLSTFAFLHLDQWALFPAALAVGVSSFPTGSMTRTRWSHILGDRSDIQTAFSLEAIVDDAAFMFGPSLATLAATAIHPVAGVALASIMLLTGGYIFLAQRDTEPPSQRSLLANGNPNPEAVGEKPPSAILNGGVAAVCVAFVCMGASFGANNITMVAMCESFSLKWVAGVVLGLGSLASMFGAAYYGARKWHVPLWKRFAVCLVMQAAISLLFLTAANLPLLIIINFCQAIVISPTFINGNALIERLVPANQLTEGLTWIGTTLSVGIATGSAFAGVFIDAFGPASGYWVLAVAAVVNIAVAVLSSRTLRVRTSRPYPKR